MTSRAFRVHPRWPGPVSPSYLPSYGVTTFSLSVQWMDVWVVCFLAAAKSAVRSTCVRVFVSDVCVHFSEHLSRSRTARPRGDRVCPSEEMPACSSEWPHQRFRFYCLVCHPFRGDFCILCDLKVKVLFFSMWIFSCFSPLCRKEYPLHIETSWHYG